MKNYMPAILITFALGISSVSAITEDFCIEHPTYHCCLMICEQDEDE